MVDAAPHIITALRQSVVEPIFGLITLPCLAEGEKVSGKAAEDIEILSPLLDGIIVFDNETWYRKIRALKSTLVKKKRSFAEKIGLSKEKQEISPEEATYTLLNESIVRRISLLLRAGEFKADGGLELAEVVLDSGELLNTMKGMGYITVGYAVEHLPPNPLSFLSWFRATSFFADEHKKKASRIVELAKQAIYHEISTPCDITSAHKALILVAGPSHELSMKGYLTVRKWIDRSIAGLETRSGDYPVMNTKNVAIIVMLSGLDNIPRITELKEIRSQFLSRQKDGIPVALSRVDLSAPIDDSVQFRSDKDEMIVLPTKTKSDKGAGSFHVRGGRAVTATQVPEKQEVLEKSPPGTDSVPPRTVLSADNRESISKEEKGLPKPRHRVIAPDQHEHIKESPPGHLSSYDESKYARPRPKTPPQPSHGITTAHPIRDVTINKETERQRIEKELQRQRMMAISGVKQKSGPVPPEQTAHSSEIVRIKREIRREVPAKDEALSPSEREMPGVPEKKRIVTVKQKVPHEPQDADLTKNVLDDLSSSKEDISTVLSSVTSVSATTEDEMKIGMKDQSYRAKDTVFEGKGIREMDTPRVRDSALIHTELKSKKSADDSAGDEEMVRVDRSGDIPGLLKKRDKKISKKDDLTWR
jgi:cell division GTPase FtsZ